MLVVISLAHYPYSIWYWMNCNGLRRMQRVAMVKKHNSHLDCRTLHSFCWFVCSFSFVCPPQKTIFQSKLFWVLSLVLFESWVMCSFFPFLPTLNDHGLGGCLQMIR